ncbi:MAG: antitoxin Xre/MbcA/ParS toxin-binding domain-containing protein [Nitriliruptoraceae bacterium]
MYRDDPLDDEGELREVLGDAAVDRLLAADDGHHHTPLETALDVLRVLQGWVDDTTAAGWFVSPQRRLEGRTPVEALTAGALEEVEDAARAWAAAHA